MLAYLQENLLEYLFDILEEERERDKAYDQAVEQCTLAGVHEALHDLLVDSETPYFQYVDSILKQGTLELKIVYKRGFRDCAALLKNLNIF